MEPEELDPVAFDSAMCAGKLFLQHYGYDPDDEACHGIVSAIVAAFIAAGGLTEENAQRWREGLRLTHRAAH